MSRRDHHEHPSSSSSSSSSSSGSLEPPERYRLAPLFALVGLALVPVVALSALLVWSDHQADAHELAVGTVPTVPAAATPVAPPAPALTTSILSYRRAPATMARSSNDTALAAAMDQLYAFVGPRSCVTVTVDGRPVSSWNGSIPVIPASTNKLLIAGVATEILGSDHRFTTSVASAPAVDGVVTGDLYLIGGGDPLLVSSGVDPTPGVTATTSLDQLADSVASSGITSVRGAVVGDASRYDSEFTNPAWGADIAYVEAGPIGGLLVNDGRITGRSGRQRDPGDAAAREFTRLLRARNISVSNGSTTGVADPALGVVATVQSPPLADIVAEMLTTSDDDTAEMLLKEVGVATGGGGSTAAGLATIDATVRSWGVPMDGVVLVDASGLSSGNRLTCDTLVGVLNHLEGTAAVAGLPVAGKSGTLVDQLVGTSVDGRMLAKTGTLTNPPADRDPPEVKALAGYVPAPDGTTLEFALVLNLDGAVTADGYVSYWEALAERLGGYPAVTDLSTFGPR